MRVCIDTNVLVQLFGYNQAARPIPDALLVGGIELARSNHGATFSPAQSFSTFRFASQSSSVAWTALFSSGGNERFCWLMVGAIAASSVIARVPGGPRPKFGGFRCMEDVRLRDP